jgi:hypothetical protein
VLLVLTGSAVFGVVCADVSSVDVFTHGEHPLCTCLRIPSVVATSTNLYAFAECREWRGDGCDPMGTSSSVDNPVLADARTHIAMKSSSDGGEHWSALTILTEGCQPTAVYDAARDTLLFMFKNNSRQDARLMTLHADGNWSAPRLVIDPEKQEKNRRPLFPGPGKRARSAHRGEPTACCSFAHALFSRRAEMTGGCRKCYCAQCKPSHKSRSAPVSGLAWT